MQVSIVNMLVAFAGGLLSFLSPCVLPLVPGYVSYVAGDALTASEYFMTAAYAAPDAPIARKALLAAAQTLAAAKQPDAAAIVYRKLLAQANLPSDIADAARQGLAALPTR